MGSRRGRHAALVAAVGATLALSCASGPPPGFSGGDTWVIPLIGTLEDGPLLVPALVNDKGPFVFAIDPDAHVSIIDEDVLAATKAITGEGPRLLDESDTQRNKFYAEILSWQLGSLTVQGPKPAQIVGKGTFDIDGRRVHGVIGRDIIADSLVFGFNRDAGVVVLATQKGFKPLADSITFEYSKLLSSVPNIDTLPLPRRLVKATIGGQSYPLHVDFGAVTSQLRPRAWDRAKLVKADVDIALVDEVGILRRAKQSGRAESVTVGGATSKDITFVPYVDRRWPDQDIEGTLGLGFFEPYNVFVNWDNDTVYLRPRDPSALSNVAGRLGRWQSKSLMGCANVGCVKVNAIDPLAGKPPEEMPAKHPGLVTSIVREPSMKQADLEVLIAVTPPEGKPPLKWLVANLPAGTDRAMTHLSAEYIGATFTVLDASPFPRTCPSQGACVDSLLPPLEFTPSSGLDSYQTVSHHLVKLKTGGLSIAPDEGDKADLVGAGRDPNLGTPVIGGSLTSVMKVCAKADGTVDRVTVLKSSGLASYDEKIQRTIREEWTYEPYVFGGKPVAFCTSVTVVYNYSGRGR